MFYLCQYLEVQKEMLYIFSKCCAMFHSTNKLLLYLSSFSLAYQPNVLTAFSPLKKQTLEKQMPLKEALWFSCLGIII